MGISYTPGPHRWVGNQRVVTVTAQFDADYTNGGEPLDASDADLDTIEDVVFEEPVSEGGYVASYRSDNGTIKMYTSGGGGSPLNEVADATDLSSESVTFQVWGRS